MASRVLMGKLSFKSSFFRLVLGDMRTGNCSYSKSYPWISFHEAVDFLQKKIMITNVQSKLEKYPLGLLMEFTEKFNQYIPYHNLTLLDVSPQRRQLPDFDAIRLCGLRGEGGPSYPQAVFVNWLLNGLGFESYLVACRVGGKQYPYSHIVTITKNVVFEGDMYLVDVAAGYATFEPIPLHDLPKYYKHAFSEYRIIQSGSEFFRQYKVKTEGFFNRVMSPKEHEGWRTLYTLEDKPRSEEFIGKYSEKVYTQPGYGAGWFLLSLKMSLYPKGKAVTLSNLTLRTWDGASGKITMTKLDGNGEIKKAIRDHFPMLQHIDVDTVLKNWHKEVEAWNLLKAEQKKIKISKRKNK